MYSLGIVQWNSTRRDHPGNPGGVSGYGPVNANLNNEQQQRNEFSSTLTIYRGISV